MYKLRLVLNVRSRPLIVLLYKSDFRSDNHSDNRTENMSFSIHLFQPTDYYRRDFHKFGSIYKCDELSARSLTPEQNVDQRLCNVHACSLQHVAGRATSCTLLLECTFQCAAGACHFSHPVTNMYISVCGRRVPLLVPSY